MSLDLKEWTNSAVSKVTDYSKLDDSLNAKEKKNSKVSRDIPSAAKKNSFEIQSMKGQANEFRACNPR